ncbi:type IV secretory system conjugative DNA transfer family protein [Rhodospirillum sp. A1_3_36]|uniref:type IV secretory system conjugative DNA transfer family protein n=1 Tax=Rhodospirillum sp. A1_3_36 TaxID=3391666 RepID=UPI0039A60BEC
MTDGIILALFALTLLWLTRKWLGHRFTPYRASLDARLLRLGRRDDFRLRDAVAGGVLILGGSGSGKTSSALGPTGFARAYLKAGYGGVVCCVKPEEAASWLELAKRCGREGDLLRFSVDGQHRFNFLDYASATVGRNGMDQNLIQLLQRITEAASGLAAQGSQGRDDAFFKTNAMQMVAHALPYLRKGLGGIQLKHLHQMIISAPQTLEMANHPGWIHGSFCSRLMLRVAEMARQGDAEAERIVEEHADYWLHDFPGMGERTRGSVVATLTGAIYPFLSGKLNELFCTDTTFCPDFCQDGTIILLDINTRTFGPAGAVAQQIFKMLFQMAMERKPAGAKTRPVFCWCDEAGFVANAGDEEHLGVCRSAKVCNVFIAQDIATFAARLGNRELANALIGKFQTRLFFSQTDMETNRFASDIMGQMQHERESRVQTDGEGRNGGDAIGEESGSYSGGHSSHRGQSLSVSTQKDYIFPPEAFGQQLRTGGRINRRRTDAIMVVSGRTFRATKSNYLKVEFRQ